MGYLNFDKEEIKLEKAIKSKDEKKLTKELINGWKADAAALKDYWSEEVKNNTDNNLENIDCEAKESYIYYTKLYHVLEDLDKKYNKPQSKSR